MIAGIARVAALAIACWVGAAAAADAPAPFHEYVIGSPKAKLTIVEFASLTCPHCAHFQTTTYPQLKKDYIDTGKVRFVFRDFPLDGLAAGAALIARCAAPDKGHKLVELLFANQETWVSSEKPLDSIKSFAKAAGIAEADVDACLQNKTLITSLQEERRRAVEVYDIQATPAFFIGDENVQGDAPYDNIKEVIEDQLKKPQKDPKAPEKKPAAPAVKTSFTVPGRPSEAAH